jgi:hypothetical protein
MAGPVTKERPAEAPARGPTRTRYEDDLYTWVGEQVGALRAGRFDEVDAEHVAEELSDVGRSEYDKLEFALMLDRSILTPQRSSSW